ncbi:hypothetical protein [Yinghuangia seranimata]|uniref:hypothetical protein n=1 Tax=Yinghuangia seranimata TaxID=408067 RepID=UPI00248D174D|nr:hypothetical protein [Yinghuangia seranimata]MDI2130956.1 hypothetical protein [Yinghuangia seranimata]
MRSVTRKAAVTAGLGAAIVAAAAGPAMAVTGGNAGVLNPQAPGVPKVAQENAGTVGPFSLNQVADKLPTNQVASGLESATQQAKGVLPVGSLPALPAVPGVPAL